MDRSFSDANLRPMRDAVQSLFHQYACFDSDAYQPDRASLSTAALLALVPARAVCDDLVAVYLQNFEGTLRVLHVPTFQRDYRQFWQTPHATKASWVAQLLAVLAVAAPLWAADPVTVDPTLSRKRVMTWLHVIDRYVRSRHLKAMRGLIILRTQCLACMARHAMFVERELQCSSTSELVRSAMSVGLHREPSQFARVSVFDAEMRRRLWASIVELDLQASLAHGLPTSVREHDFDTQPPANHHDATLFAEMQNAEVPEPAHVLTDTTSQGILARSLRTRLRAMHLINDVVSEIEYNDVLPPSRELERVLAELPTPLKLDARHDGRDPDGCGRTLQRVLLDLFVRRVLLALHRAFAGSATDLKLIDYSRRICVESSLMVLAHQHIFRHQLPDAHAHQVMLQRLLKEDCLHAALTICSELKQLDRTLDEASNAPSPTAKTVMAPPLRTRSGTAPVGRTDLLLSVQKTMEVFVGRVSHLDSDLVFALFLSLALAAVKAQGSLDLAEILMREETRNLIRVGMEAHARLESRKNGEPELQDPSGQDLLAGSFHPTVRELCFFPCRRWLILTVDIGFECDAHANIGHGGDGGTDPGTR